MSPQLCHWHRICQVCLHALGCLHLPTHYARVPARAAEPPHTLCMPSRLAHTTVTRYSTRHSRPQSATLSAPLHQHHRPPFTTIIYTALLLSARALLRLCSLFHRQHALLLERGHRARPLAQPNLRHRTHLRQQTHPHDAVFQENTDLGCVTRHGCWKPRSSPKPRRDSDTT